MANALRLLSYLYIIIITDFYLYYDFSFSNILANLQSLTFSD